MIRAALALIRGDRRARAFLSRRSPGNARFDAHYTDAETGGYYLTADDAEGLVAAAAFDRRRRHRPIPNAVAAQNLVRLAVLAGDDAWREPSRPIDRGRAGRGGFQSVRPCGAAQCARLAPARGRDRGHRAQAEDFAQAALKLPFLDRIVLRAKTAADLPPTHPAQDKLERRGGQRGLRLRRRALLIAGDDPERIGAAVAAMRA